MIVRFRAGCILCASLLGIGALLAAAGASAATLSPPTLAFCVAQIHRACYTAAELQTAYGLKPLYAKGLNGAGSTIVIVDPFGSPTIGADLQAFDQAMHLPNPPKFRIVQPTGPVPPYDVQNGEEVNKAGETTLDVEWSHAIAPGANILLVETATPETAAGGGFPQYMQAIDYVLAHNLGDVVSQSYSLPEANFGPPSHIMRLRYAYQRAVRQHVTVLAATNDTGVAGPLPSGYLGWNHRVVQWPATDPLVTGVGGTMLDLSSTGQRQAPDAAWNDTLDPWVPPGPPPQAWATSGGVSSVFTRPAWQTVVKRVVGSRRGVPDISMSASLSGGVLTYASYPLPKKAENGWGSVGGTSEATPEFAGIVAIADQYARERLHRGRLGLINPALYKLYGRLGSGTVDVVRGDNTVSFRTKTGTTTIQGYRAAPGYDLTTGVGTLNAAQFVPALARAVWPSRPTHRQSMR